MDEGNEFKKMFKYYKQKNPPPNLQDVINPQSEKDRTHFEEVPVSLENDNYNESLHCNPRNTWRVLSCDDNPGFLLILNVLSNSHQLYWTSRCLKTYSSSKYRRNLDAHLEVGDWLQHCQAHPQVVDKLRWSTLGYHHNWNTKEYDESDRGEFPEDLANLSSYIAGALGYNRYKAEAAIVNYYPPGTTLSGHTDHSEHNLSAPLISISLGQSAIFLLGGQTLNTKPAAYLLSSGSVAVMTKEARLSYHAVPRILTEADLESVHQGSITPHQDLSVSDSVKSFQNVTKTSSVGKCDNITMSHGVKSLDKVTQINHLNEQNKDNDVSNKETFVTMKKNCDKRKSDEYSDDIKEKKGKVDSNVIDAKYVKEHTNFAEENDNEKSKSDLGFTEKEFLFVKSYIGRHRINLNIRQVNSY